MPSPFIRHRRLRSSAALRQLVRETQLTVNDFIQPLFVIHGTQQRVEIPSMPGVYQLSIDQLDTEINQIVEVGIQAVLLFGIPETKDAQGSSAYQRDGIVQQATQKIKQAYPHLLVITDACLCQYTTTGHCGIITTHPDTGQVSIDNDASLSLIAQVALAQAKAGADMIAPSNMMDGTVAVIRSTLDQAGYPHIPIMAYAVKYASAFYGPFRDAAESKPQFGDRKSYQMDPANAKEALREAASDEAEGADFLMVKPAFAYMDIIHRVREQSQLPLVVYSVSGEYAMMKAAAIQGWINEREVVMESMLGLKRAGADLIITYYATDIAKWLRGNRLFS